LGKGKVLGHDDQLKAILVEFDVGTTILPLSIEVTGLMPKPQPHRGCWFEPDGSSSYGPISLLGARN